MTSFIVSGTDTGIGKTWVTVALIRAFLDRGERVLGMKPLASGCEVIDNELRNEDALLIQQAGWQAVDYSLVNPYAFKPPVSPHAAAAKEGVQVSLETILECYEILQGQADRVIIEGVGGWRVPFSDELSLKDLVKALELPVIMVVGLKLGCINHALLTAEALDRDGIELRAWVANQLESDYLMQDATLRTLETSIPAPLLGLTPCLQTLQPDKLAEALDVDVLID